MSGQRWWKASADEKTGAGELLLYGQIGDGWWSDVTSRGFVEDVKGLGDLKSLTIRINSIGGDVFAGQAIYSFLKGRPYRKEVVVDGIAASVASMIAMAGDTIIVPANATMMVHNPWGLSIGEAEDMRKEADILDKLRGQMADVYASRTGKTREEIVALMDAETWMTGEEAVALGFADEVGEPVRAAASLKGDMIVFSSEAGAFEASRDMIRAFRHGDRAEQAFSGATRSGDKGAGEEATMNLDELKERHPEVYAEAVEVGRTEGAERERNRIRALDGLRTPDTEEIVERAKYEEIRSAEECALDLCKAMQAGKALEDRRADASVCTVVKGMTPGGMPGEKDREREEFLGFVRKHSEEACARARSQKGVA